MNVQKCHNSQQLSSVKIYLQNMCEQIVLPKLYISHFILYINFRNKNANETCPLISLLLNSIYFSR